MDKIAVCCGTPLVPTMKFSGAEYYCVSCGATPGLLDVTRVELTPELEREKLENEEAFREVAKNCVPYGSYKKDCEKCKDEMHICHASKEELDNSSEAYRKLVGGIDG